MQLTLPAAEFKSKQFHKIGLHVVVRLFKDWQEVEATLSLY